jgi:putative effector of murein hydrolase LrgA (UPF0299 family)
MITFLIEAPLILIVILMLILFITLIIGFISCRKVKEYHSMSIFCLALMLVPIVGIFYRVTHDLFPESESLDKMRGWAISGVLIIIFVTLFGCIIYNLKHGIRK